MDVFLKLGFDGLSAGAQAAANIAGAVAFGASALLRPRAVGGEIGGIGIPLFVAAAVSSQQRAAAAAAEAAAAAAVAEAAAAASAADHTRLYMVTSGANSSSSRGNTGGNTSNSEAKTSGQKSKSGTANRKRTSSSAASGGGGGDDPKKPRKIPKKECDETNSWYDDMIEDWETKAHGDTNRRYYLYKGKWYSPDNDGHAGSVAKIYEPTGSDPTRPKTLKFEGSVDSDGRKIPKHESNWNKGQKGDIKGSVLHGYEDRRYKSR